MSILKKLARTAGKLTRIVGEASVKTIDIVKAETPKAIKQAREGWQEGWNSVPAPEAQQTPPVRAAEEPPKEAKKAPRKRAPKTPA